MSAVGGARRALVYRVTRDSCLHNPEPGGNEPIVPSMSID
jgi:hypothetical protein